MLSFKNALNLAAVPVAVPIVSVAAFLATFLATFLAVAFVSAFPAVVAAAEEETVTWYDVEIIIFRQANPRTSETWPADTGIPAVDGIRPLFSAGPDETEETSSEVLAVGLEDDQALPPGAPAPYEPLPREEFQMQGIADSLARSSHYDPLLHAAWTQPGVSYEQAVPLRITLPEAFRDDGMIGDPSAENVGSDESEPRYEQFPSATGAPSANGQDVPESSLEDGSNDAAEPGMLDTPERPDLKRPLDGSILVYVRTYLHMNLDLLYLPADINPDILGEARLASEETVQSLEEQRRQRKQAILEALARGDMTLEEAEIMSLEPEQELFEGFRLQAKRRMRSREIHYFDHPVFGVITTVTPREIPLSMDDGLRQ